MGKKHKHAGNGNGARQSSIVKTKGGVALVERMTGDEPATTPPKMSRRAFEEELYKLHVELVKLQEWVKSEGKRIVVVFEGRDTAGKGGTIRCITERVSPRVFRVVALPAPSERERSQMYIQRYLRYLPAAGEIVIFDRSWYNRAGVEKIMGLCTEQQYKTFLAATPLVENSMIHDGIILIKYWLEVSPDEQARRLQARIDDGRKTWKLSPMDLESAKRYYDYSRARDAMFAETDSPTAPWHVVWAEDKRRARLNCITHLLSTIPYKESARDEPKLPKPQARGDYVEPVWPFRWVPELY